MAKLSSAPLHLGSGFIDSILGEIDKIDTKSKYEKSPVNIKPATFKKNVSGVIKSSTHLAVFL